MVIVGHALCPAIYHYMVENSKDLNSPNRQYILIPSGFYKTRISVEVDFVVAGHAVCPAILYSVCLLILDEFSFDFHCIYIISCKTIIIYI